MQTFFQVNFSWPVLNTEIFGLYGVPEILLSAAISIIVLICDNVKSFIWDYTFPIESSKAFFWLTFLFFRQVLEWQPIVKKTFLMP